MRTLPSMTKLKHISLAKRPSAIHKAKSRLHTSKQNSKKTTHHQSKDRSLVQTNSSSAFFHHTKRASLSEYHSSTLIALALFIHNWFKYHAIFWFRARLKALVGIVVFSLYLWWLLTQVRPGSVADMLIPQSYLPFLIGIGGLVYCVTALAGSMTIAVLCAIWSSITLYLVLQRMYVPAPIWTLWWSGLLLVCLLGFSTRKLLVKRRISDILRHSKAKIRPPRRHRS